MNLYSRYDFYNNKKSIFSTFIKIYIHHLEDMIQ